MVSGAFWASVTKTTACGLLTETGVKITFSPFTESVIGSSTIVSPIFTVAYATSPQTVCKSSVRIPERVSTVRCFLSVYPLSKTYLPTQRMPLPHILASLPSALKIRILKSATSEGERRDKNYTV